MMDTLEYVFEVMSMLMVVHAAKVRFIKETFSFVGCDFPSIILNNMIKYRSIITIREKFSIYQIMEIICCRVVCK